MRLNIEEAAAAAGAQQVIDVTLGVGHGRVVIRRIGACKNAAHRVDQVAQGSPEPVEPPHDEGVA